MNSASRYNMSDLPQLAPIQILNFLAFNFQFPQVENRTSEMIFTIKAIVQMELYEELDMPSIELLQQDYTRLFINSFPHLLAPPYAAVYLKNNQNLISDLNKLYEQFNYYPIIERSDHIIVELQFLILLLKQNAIVPAVDFIDHHLFQWVIPFTEQVKKNSQTQYYSTIAKLTLHAFEKIRREFWL